LVDFGLTLVDFGLTLADFGLTLAVARQSIDACFDRAGGILDRSRCSFIQIRRGGIALIAGEPSENLQSGFPTAIEEVDAVRSKPAIACWVNVFFASRR
jgi:hypothetical protein